ncbi:hypothetical protein JL722_568 [Aureococcus anophagefferens]|nr:hypothetical protein JL722_568 [Aureococcus anophagefferens]
MQRRSIHGCPGTIAPSMKPEVNDASVYTAGHDGQLTMGWPRYEHVSPDLFPVAAEAMDRGPARRSRFDDWDWVDVDGWETVRYACACPCLALGKVATLASAGEPTIPPLNFTRNGLDLCVASAPLGPCSAAAATVWQRRALADRYGLPGGPREALKGLIYPLALAQHLALAEAVAARGERRFAWERADHWKKDDRPAVPDFHVLIVAGVAQAGATSLVRSLVGAEPVDEDAEVDGDRSSGGSALRAPSASARASSRPTAGGGSPSAATTPRAATPPRLFADEGRYSEYARMFLDASPALRHGTSTYAVDAPCRLKAAKADPPAGGALWLGEVEAAPNRAAALDAVAAGLARRRGARGAVAVSKPFAGGSRLAFALVFDAAADLAAFRSATFDPLLADALVDGAALLVDDVTTLVASNDDERGADLS